MKIVKKIVLKYKTPDKFWVEKGQVYVGQSHPCDELNCTSWKDVESATVHSSITSEPTEVKILTFSIEEN